MDNEKFITLCEEVSSIKATVNSFPCGAHTEDIKKNTAFRNQRAGGSKLAHYILSYLISAVVVIAGLIGVYFRQ